MEWNRNIITNRGEIQRSCKTNLFFISFARIFMSFLRIGCISILVDFKCQTIKDKKNKKETANMCFENWNSIALSLSKKFTGMAWRICLNIQIKFPLASVVKIYRLNFKSFIIFHDIHVCGKHIQKTYINKAYKILIRWTKTYKVECAHCILINNYYRIQEPFLEWRLSCRKPKILAH